MNTEAQCHSSRAMRSTDAWMTMCWTNDGAQLNRDMPEIKFVLGKDGGEIWTDYYAIPKDAPNKPAFASARVDPGKPYRHVMIYRLSTN